MGIFSKMKDSVYSFVGYEPNKDAPSNGMNTHTQNHWTYPFGYMNGSIQRDRYNAGVNLFETAVQRVAQLLSKIEIQYFQNQEVVKDELTEVLKVRPNQKQTPTEFWYTFFYQMLKYDHGIAYPVYENDKIKELYVVDLAIHNVAIVQDENSVEYLQLRTCYNKTTDEISLIPYKDVLHLRNHPESVFTNEVYYGNFNNIPYIIDENLSAMLSELKSNYDIQGVFKIGGSPSSTMQGVGANVQVDNEIKKQKVDEIVDRIKQKILVLDSGESFDPITAEFQKSTVTDMKELIKFYYQLLGIPEEIISSTWTYEQYSAFYEAFISPRVKSLEEEMNYKLLTKTARTQGKEINIVVSKVSGMSFKDLSTFLLQARYQGVFSQNMIYKELGYAPLKGGDEIIGNLNMNKDLEVNATKGGDNDE